MEFHKLLFDAFKSHFSRDLRSAKIKSQFRDIFKKIHKLRVCFHKIYDSTQCKNAKFQKRGWSNGYDSRLPLRIQREAMGSIPIPRINFCQLNFCHQLLLSLI